VSFIENDKRKLGHRLCAGLGMGLAGLLAGCSNAPPGPPATPPASAVVTEGQSRPSPVRPQAPAQHAKPAPTLAPPKPVRSHDELRRQAALRLIEANPGGVYMSEPPLVLLAIPVLEIELHADGRVKVINVLRHPGQARDTVELAIQAVRRAAPFGDVSRMPKPWKFNEVFLFNDQRLFKPRTLD